ncbi:MAG TPA: ABC transporter substrate-binding protein [Treponemataceae bacterium]|nr:ABC transporter substrate-binding protein [Treponemataceae bacterium]
MKIKQIKWKEWFLILAGFFTVICAVAFLGCTRTSSSKTLKKALLETSFTEDGLGNEQDLSVNQEQLILGFSQIGAESAWRNCNSQSIKNAAKESGVQLLFENAEQKQENQIKAIRSFIAYQVDVIAFVPIVTSGWDNVLREAKDAGIPVLATDRKIETDDITLYAGFIGTDSEQEGRHAAQFLQDSFPYATLKKGIRIVEISGTEGSSVAIGRAEGFRKELRDHPEFSIVFSRSGDFLRSKGYEIMSSILENSIPFDAVYSHNDGMTLGAIEAMKEWGLKPGVDVIIVSIDAEQAAIDALKLGEINCVIECNPKTGPLIIELSRKLARGQQIPRLIHVEEQVFRQGDANLDTLPPRGY